MRFYRVEGDAASRFTGDLSRAAHKWGLPGVEPCAACGVGGGWAGLQYPCVDLSGFSKAELKPYSDPWPVPFEVFARLRERIRTLAPEGAVLEPGTRLGPLTGTAAGAFGPITLQDWTLVARDDALAALHGAGLQGLTGCRLDVTFRDKSPPVLRELQLALHGRIHPDCFTQPRASNCAKCGSEASERLPDTYWLAQETLPTQVDLFRLRDYPTLIIATERTVDAADRLKLEGVTFQPVDAR
ncbi:double-CXXCG motif protein [Corallococcus macrosporus]|uniref:SitI6 family double-CXXCG motif immunity protein n=1 Tax=Corallococcus macrosporus TaxID=35 RepID=UPI00030D0C82|nr:double-CXXCG motif protein [Corallococcus macrosporus]